MIEPAMYLGIGFLIASLLGLIFMPLVHARAVRLTIRRMEAATPMSMAEIQADKDQLRAEFAMSTRRLEISLDQLKAKNTSQFAELGKKNDAVSRLKADLGEKSATISALEAREKALTEQISATEDELAAKTQSLHETSRNLTDKQTELARVSSDLSDRTATTESQRIEMISLSTQIEALKVRIGDYEQDIKKTQGRLEKEKAESAKTVASLNEERGKVETLGQRIGQLEEQLATQTSESEALSKRAAELDERIADQKRLLVEREFECDRLRAELENARRTGFHLREEIASTGGQLRETIRNLTDEKEVLQKELEVATTERSKLLTEVGSLKREAESTWAAERVENALLRERINDVAAEVAKLAVTLEGPNSPIEAILASEVTPASKGVGKSASTETDDDHKGSLADRMRALQNRASRLAPQS